MHLIAGTAGTLLAGLLMSRPAAGDPRYVVRLLAWTTALMTLPSIALLWVASTKAAVVLLWIFVPGVYFYIGPILGLLQNVMPANMRATGCAILLFIANSANLVLAPQMVGLLSDWFGHSFAAGQQSLPVGVGANGVLGGVASVWASGATIRQDEDRILALGQIGNIR